MRACIYTHPPLPYRHFVFMSCLHKSKTSPQEISTTESLFSLTYTQKDYDSPSACTWRTERWRGFPAPTGSPLSHSLPTKFTRASILSVPLEQQKGKCHPTDISSCIPSPWQYNAEQEGCKLLQCVARMISLSSNLIHCFCYSNEDSKCLTKTTARKKNMGQTTKSTLICMSLLIIFY